MDRRAQDPAEQATQWFVRLLEPDCPADERAAFERWRADPTHAAAYQRVEALWADGEAVVQDPEVSAVARKDFLYRASPRAGRWWVPATAFAALGVVAILVVPRWLAAPEPPPGTRYATAAGEQRSITLEDGSTLLLDTQTVILERYSPRERRMDLQQGQAQFQVQGNPNRPFVVHTQGGTVTAVGTRFQVRVTEANATVTLLEGKVTVARESGASTAQHVALQAGQRLSFGPEGRIGPAQPVDLKTAEGWTQGKLFVERWRLQDVVTEMNRYTATQFRIDDPALREIPISGIFRTGDRDMLARVLAQGWGIQARPISDREVLLTRE